MPKKIIFFLLCALLLSVQISVAASVDNPAYRKLSLYRVGLSDFGLDLAYDEQLCKQLYGGKWQSRCASAPGKFGETVKGVAMKPAASGHWEWTGGSSLQFVPDGADSIKPDTTYNIDISGVSLPSSLKLDKRGIIFHSWPFAVQLQKLAFLTDPSPASRHILTLSLKFNYPAPQNFRHPTPDAPGVSFGKAEIAWNGDRTELSMAWPAMNLPEQKTTVKIDCGHISQIQENNGKIFLTKPDAKQKTFFSLLLPGENDLFVIKNAQLKPALSDNLDQEYELQIESSLYAQASDLLENMAVLQLPPTNTPEAVEPCNWMLSPAIGKDAIKRGKELKPVLHSSDNAQSRFTFRIKPDAGAYIFLVIDKNLKSSSGLALNRNFMKILYAPDGGASLSFMQPGNILPLHQNGSLDFHSTGLDAIHWEMRKIRDPFLALMARGQYIFENGSSAAINDMDSVSLIGEGTLVLGLEDAAKAQYSSLDIADELTKLENKPSGLFLLSLKGMHKGEAVAWSSRLVLASNLGLLLKRSLNGSLDCFTQNLQNGEAIANAEIKVLAANGQSVANGLTDAQGHLSLPSLSGLKRELRPVAAVAVKNGNIAWLPLEDAARKVNYSNFNTGGITSFADGLNAFVFTQRGVYRPGDELNFGIIVKKGDFSPLSSSFPVRAEILDPRGSTVFAKTIRIEEPGISECLWKAPEDAISGKYIFNIRTAKDATVIGSQIVRVEEFQPDSLRLEISPPPHSGWVLPGQKPPALLFRLENLYGTAAPKQKIGASLSASPAIFSFKGYEDYTFSDPLPLAVENLQRNLPAVFTNEKGEASIDIPSDFCRLASASINVTAEGFEAGGGRAVARNASFLMSSAKKLLGWRPRGEATDLQFIPAGAKARLDLLALDNTLKKSAWNGLECSLFLQNYVTSLISDASGGYKYDEMPIGSIVKTWSVSLPEKGLTLDLPTQTPGEYVLAISDNGKTVARIPFRIAGAKPLAPGEYPAASKMRARTDKTIYDGGDIARVSLILPYDGTGLITLERDGVEAFARFSARAGESVQELRLPENFEGKGYITISFARDVNSPAIYMNPFVCAVMPIMVNSHKRDMDLTLKVPEKTEPGSPLRVELSSRQKGKAIIFAVDEGIHLLTNYTKPDPLAELLGNRALNVDTIQAYDLLMPSNLHIRSSAFGGGMDGVFFGKKFRNPFKRKSEPPLIYWSGVVDTGPDKKALEIPVASWQNGNLRIYAAGVSENGTGSASASTIISAPLILTPVVPLNLAPGDAFTGQLLVENTGTQKIKALLKANFGDSIKLEKSLPPQVEIDAISRIILPFEARALDRPGAAEIIFNAECAGRKYERKASLSVRPASILKTTFMAGRTDKPALIETDRQLYEDSAKSRAILSPLPLPLLQAFREYLEYYPHGCTEQLVSRAFAMLLSREWLKDDQKLEKQLMAAISAVRSRMNSSGLSLWQGSDPDLLLSIYAADFLLSLQATGFGSQQDMLEQLSAIIQVQTSLNTASLEDARTCAYGIWVLTRQGRITTQLIENLLINLAEKNVDGWETDLTAVLIAASMKEMHMTRNLPQVEMIDYADGKWLDEYAQKALHFYILARNFPEKLDQAKRNDFYEASEELLNSGNFTTFSSCMGIRALAQAEMEQSARLMETKISCQNDKKGQYKLANHSLALEYETGECPRLEISMPENGQTMFWQLASTGYDKKPLKASENGISIRKNYLDKNGGPASTFRQGDEIIVELEARSNKGPIKDCAISDILPGGTEMIFERVIQNSKEERIKNIDRQEDRIILYADLDNEPLKFTFRIRAVNCGNFLAPGASAEAMYKPMVNGQGESGSLIISAND